MIALLCISQVKYVVEETPYYCYTASENRIIAIYIDESDTYLKRIEIKESQIDFWKKVVNSMEQDAIIYEQSIKNLTKRFDAQVELTNVYYNALEDETKSHKTTKTILIGSVILDVILIAIIIL